MATGITIHFNVKPAYEFGYGLSYTTFSLTNLKLSSANFKNEITATIDVTNTGKVPGKEVVQLYVSAPAKKMDKPSEELKAFAKTGLLQPGKTQKISFKIKAGDLASFETNIASWVAEAGTYTIKAGTSSMDIKQKADFTLSNDIIVEKDSNLLSPKIQIDEMKK